MMQFLFAISLTAFSVLHHGGNENNNGTTGSNNAISKHPITFWPLFCITALTLGILLFLAEENFLTSKKHDRDIQIISKVQLKEREHYAARFLGDKRVPPADVF